MTEKKTSALWLLLATLGTFAGCGMGYLDIGYDVRPEPVGTSGMGGTTTAAISSGSGGAATTASTSSSGGTASTGGASSSFMGGTCTPGATQSCYSGPAGTAGVGICKAGTQTCAASGSWGTCVGEVLPQVENCATPVDEDCDGKAPPCAGIFQWAERFGGAQNQYVKRLAVDAAGDIILTGFFEGSMDFGGGPLTSVGPLDTFVAKLSPTGGHLWSKRFGATAATEAKSIAVDAAGNVTVAGVLTGTADFGGGVLASAGGNDVFVVKLDATGSHLWSKRFGDASTQNVASVAVDSTGNVFVIGDFAGSIDFGGGALTTSTSDVFVAKLDANGAHKWSKRLGVASGQDGAGIAVDSKANVLLSGHFSGKIDLGGGALTSTLGGGVFVAKLDPSGNHVWSKSFVGAGAYGVPMGHGFAVDAWGNALVMGSFAGSVDFGAGPLTSAGGQDIFVAKLDPSGGYLWAQRFGDANDQQGASVAVDATGNVLLTGAMAGQTDFGGGPLASAGGRDVFVVKLDAGNANHLWSKRFGDASDQNGESLAADVAGNVIVTGNFYGAVDFGSGPLASAGAADIFLAKFSP